MADTDLFMECEEEELEPWQRIEDDVVDDTGAEATPSSVNHFSSGVKSGFGPVSVSDVHSTEPAKKTLLTVLSSTNSVGASVMGSSRQPLIMTQSSSSLGSMTVSPVYQPTTLQVLQDPKTGSTSTVSGQPILITTQGFTVKDLRSVQNPLGIVLNVQSGQGITPYQAKPLTLVPATTQFMKSTVGVPQLWSPVTSIRPATSFPGTVTTVIPATVTIRSSTTSSPSNPHPQSKPQPLPQPPAHSQPQAPATLLQAGLKQGHVIHITNNDNKLVNFLQNTNLVRVSQKGPISSEAQRSKAEDLVKGSILPPLQTTTVTSTSSHQAKPTLNTTTAFKGPVADTSVNNGVPIPKACPKCNIHFNVMESLKLHMSYCCPSLVSSPSPPSKSTLLQCSAPQPKPPQTPGLVQGKLIMLVDDFYYGRDEGSTYQMLHQMKTSTTFRCLSCLKRLKNNIRFMNHMKHHLELERQNDDSIENHTTCQHCFRQYATPFLLQCHIDNVHSPYETTTKCKICELAFETEQLFLQHMKDTHKPGEMPYVCQVCDYRSSVYMEVDNHFRMIHEDTKNLLCPYCLKVLKNSSAYQQHYMKHQKKSVYPCNKCRLQFISAKEKLEHKTEHHKTFKKPKQLEGLQPGTKVTIRTSMGQARAIGGSSQESPPTKVYIAPQPHKPQDPPASSTTQLLAPVAKALPRLEKRKGVERTYTLLIDMQEFRNMYGDQVCLECNLDISNVSNHFPKYVHCSRCRYSTSCSRAYADHMISYHTLRGKPKYLMFGKVRKSGILLTCSSCSFTVDKADGDEMARHLDTNPAHKSCRILIFTGLLMKLLPKQRKSLLLWTATPQTSSTSTSSSSSTNATATQPAPLSTTIFPLQQNPFTGPPAYEAKHSVIKIQTQKSLLLSAVCSSDHINVKASPAAGSLSALPSATPPSETQHRLEGAGGKGGSPSQEPSGISGLGAAHGEQASDCLPSGAEDESGEEAGVGQGLSQGREEGGEDQSSGEAERGASSSLVAPSWPLGERELCVVLHALCCGAREAAEHYREPESRVAQWLGECAGRLGGRAGAWDSPEEEEQLVEWVVLRREQQLPLTGEALAQRLLEAREPGGRRELRDTYERALALLLRWGLGAQVRATVGRRLTPGMEQDVTDFVDFTRRQLAAQSFPLAAIANVDEVPIFLDTAAKPGPGSEPGIRSDSLRLSGSGQPDLVVSLAILADGTLLPVLVSAHGPCPSWLRVPPGLLLEVREEGYSEAEVARLWFSRVWQPYVRRRRQGHKTLLVLDSFRMHLSDTFIHQLGISNTLPLVVPQGCTARLQPLDMCLGPAFRRFLSHKWLAYARKVAGELLPRGDLLQSLLNWVSEAADFFSTNAELVRRSFLVAGLLPEPGWDADLRAHMQEELTSFLEEQLEEDGDSEGEGEGETGRLRADPKLLVKIFNADSDIESFHGFHESDM